MRNSANTIKTWEFQVNQLIELVPDLRVVVGVGDCTDDTEALLAQIPGIEVVDVSHGGPAFGSIDHAERWDNIAKAVRATLDYMGDPGEKFIWVEDDLLWSVDAMFRLLAHTEWYAAIAPAVIASGERRFYDTWGFRLNGKQFLPHEPYAPEEPLRSDGNWKIDSCGSCFVACTEDTLDRSTLRQWLSTWSGHWPATCDGLLWMDTKIEVYHP
jgi:hypothetical protein